MNIEKIIKALLALSMLASIAATSITASANEDEEEISTEAPCDSSVEECE